MPARISDGTCVKCSTRTARAHDGVHYDQCSKCRRTICDCGNRKSKRRLECGACHRKREPYACRVCRAVLGDTNWRQGEQNTSSYICRDCANKQSAERKRTTRHVGITRNANLRAEVLTAYGGMCVCCGETSLQFLTIDHVFGDGHSDRNQPREAVRNCIHV